MYGLIRAFEFYRVVLLNSCCVHFEESYGFPTVCDGVDPSQTVFFAEVMSRIVVFFSSVMIFVSFFFLELLLMARPYGRMQ